MIFGGVPTHRQRFVAEYVLPPDLGESLRSKYPSLSSIGVAQRGLRQWLRLSLLAPGDLAQPSTAVGILAAEFGGHGDYSTYAIHAFGHDSVHRDHRLDPHPPDGDSLALTFAMACVDEGLPLHYPDSLPLLFAVDAALTIQDGQHWVLNCGRSPCNAGAACIRHELLPRVPDRLPKQIRFNVVRPSRLADKSDRNLDLAPFGIPGVGLPYGGDCSY